MRQGARPPLLRGDRPGQPQRHGRAGGRRLRRPLAPAFPGWAPGRQGLKQAFRLFWETTPGYHRIEDQVAEGDRVVTRMTAIGTHEGDLLGAPRTGNRLEMTAITIHRVEEGKLVEKWSNK